MLQTLMVQMRTPFLGILSPADLCSESNLLSITKDRVDAHLGIERAVASSEPRRTRSRPTGREGSGTPGPRLQASHPS